MQTLQLRIVVSGIVQGVFFRVSTQDKAQFLNLKGWVRNLSDGTVEICAQGFKPQLDDLLDWCYRGPDNAQVTNVDVEPQPVTQLFEAFEILPSK